MLGGIYIIKKNSLVKQVKLKSHSRTQKSAFSTVTKSLAERKKLGKFIRKSLVPIPVLKGYMVSQVQNL